MKRKLLLPLLACSVLMSPPDVLSAKKHQSFTEWLERYSAYDVLERELATSSDHSPSMILKHAQTLLTLKTPAEAEIVLDKTGSFPNSTLEQERLWLLGDSQRQQGNLEQAVFSYSRALAHGDSHQIQERIRSDSSLITAWRDVWRNWLWRWQVSKANDEESLLVLLRQSAAQASMLWPADTYWKDASALITGSERDRNHSIRDQKNLSVLETDRMLLGRAFSAISIGQTEEARNLFGKMSSPVLRRFWTSVSEFLQSGVTPASTLPYHEQNLSKAAAFWEGYVQNLGAFSRKSLFIKDIDQPSWPIFRATLQQMPPLESVAAIKRELESSLISQETVQALTQLKIVFALKASDYPTARDEFDKIDSSSLPLSLKISEVLLFGASPDEAGETTTEVSLLQILAEAAGLAFDRSANAPFWLVTKGASPLDYIIEWPFDPVLLLGSWRSMWDEKKDDILAKRIGFLFGDTPLGIEALLHLAKQSGQNGQLQKTAFYLEQVDRDNLPSDLKADYLQARAALEIELGQERQALTSYMNLMNLDSKRLGPEKKLKLALLAQRQGRLQWAEEILQDLWAERSVLEPEVQAEILFWLAEGAGAMGQMEKALERYLRVGWQYPEQNIWAVTAMYRASVIYERAGKYESARKLLKTVIKNADTKAQKEAAEDRLKVVDAELNKRKISKDKKDLPYPY